MVNDVEVEVISEQEYMREAGHLVDWAVSSPGTTGQAHASGDNEVRAVDAHERTDGGEVEAMDPQTQTDGDGSVVREEAPNAEQRHGEDERARHDAAAENAQVEADEDEDEEGTHGARDDHRHWRYGEGGRHNYGWHDSHNPEKQHKQWRRQPTHVPELPEAVMEAAGKTMRGDSDEEDAEAVADEADDDEGPARMRRDGSKLQRTHGQQMARNVRIG